MNSNIEERKDKLAGTILINFKIKMYKLGCRHNLGLKYIGRTIEHEKINYVRIRIGKKYIASIIDFYTREIIAYNLSKYPHYCQINKMFKELEKKHRKKSDSI